MNLHKSMLISKVALGLSFLKYRYLYEQAHVQTKDGQARHCFQLTCVINCTMLRFLNSAEMNCAYMFHVGTKS